MFLGGGLRGFSVLSGLYLAAALSQHLPLGFARRPFASSHNARTQRTCVHRRIFVRDQYTRTELQRERGQWKTLKRGGKNAIAIKIM